MEILQNLPPAVTLVLVLLLVVWLVLLLLVPFMIESIRGSTRKAYLELEEMNHKLDRIATLLERGAEPTLRAEIVRPVDLGVDVRPPVREPRSERARREPTISS
jgi:hypothetical protein